MSGRFFFAGNCKFFQSAFSGERVFELSQATGGAYIGIAPVHYCHKEGGESLASNEPIGDNSLTGMLAVRLIANGGNKAVVALPDGETVSISCELLSPREPEKARVSF